MKKLVAYTINTTILMFIYILIQIISIQMNEKFILRRYYSFSTLFQETGFSYTKSVIIILVKADVLMLAVYTFILLFRFNVYEVTGNQ